MKKQSVCAGYKVYKVIHLLRGENTFSICSGEKEAQEVLISVSRLNGLNVAWKTIY